MFPYKNSELKNNQRGNAVQNKQSLVFAFVILYIAGAVFLTINSITQSSNKTANTTNNRSSQNNRLHQDAPTVQELELNDSQTVLYFSNRNTLYAKALDGTAAREIAQLPNTIVGLKPLLNNTLGIETDAYLYKKKYDPQTNAYYYEVASNQKDAYIFTPATGELTSLKENQSEQLSYFIENLLGEKYFTVELQNEQADIFVEKFNNETPEKIGRLKEMYIKQPCGVPTACKNALHPDEFFPSFNGSYLLNKPRGGGGIGTPGLVVSRNGNVVFNIDFVWFISSAIWIGNDTLLTRGQFGDQKLYTFLPNGSYSEKILSVKANEYFNPHFLSPSKRFLVSTDIFNQISYYDIQKDTLLPIAQYEKDRMYSQYNLNSNIQTSHRYTFLSWNLASDKILFAETVTNVTENQIIFEKIKLYDIGSGSTVEVADVTQASFENSTPAQSITSNFVLR